MPATGIEPAHARVKTGNPPLGDAGMIAECALRFISLSIVRRRGIEPHCRSAWVTTRWSSMDPAAQTKKGDPAFCGAAFASAGYATCRLSKAGPFLFRPMLGAKG